MDNQEQNESWLEKNKTVFIVLGSFLILAIVVILVFLAMRFANESKTKTPPPIPAATSTAPVTPVASSTATLPSIGEAGQTGAATGTAASEQLAEKASFGDFYRPTSSLIVLAPANLTLPFNAKTEAANYYDVDRKMSLDAGLDSLNNNGFAVLDNPFSAEADGFFQMYAALDAKQVPTLITGDFLVYYYQNVLKLAYREVESTVFYDNLWAADQRLYQLAKQRYENNLNQKGTINEVALEASRLETAYFATALSLLAPMDDQISAASGLSGSTNFSSSEASQYSLQLPAYLTDDVGAELKLIRAANAAVKSPVLLYQRDYQTFAVPANYQSNARLHNFYLASRWLNSVFPLYYRDANCLNCLLDKDDWRINVSTAFLISSDLAADQNLQNRWAKIYKIQSFFSGLRGDLNYLNYERVFNDAFSGKSDITQILQGAPADNDANLALLQNKLAAIDFSALEGGLNKTATATKPLLGFKMLTGSFWPDDYIFSQLNYPATGLFSGSDKTAQTTATACPVPGKVGYYRCVGSARDVLNLIYPLSGSADDYFTANANYTGYAEQSQSLRKLLANFNVNAWHANSYWSTMDISSKFLRARELTKVAVMNSAAWQNRNKDLALAAWANDELTADTFAPYKSRDATRLNQTGTGNLTPLYQYIEPDLTLSRELIFNTRMIIQMLSLLGVSDGENTVLTDLKTMEKNLSGAEAIIGKELQNQELNEEDYAFINDFAHAFSVASGGSKSFSLTSISGASRIRENLSGVKLLVYSFARGDKKFLAVGPIFNFREEK
ncbi:MAG: DUF3160 domain-containing protein [Patescibacteria group bacterium]|nr:DUF3160 domain-containing protein [Patescibacteria group bacterium]